MLLFVLLTLPLLAASRSLNCVCKDSNVSLKVVPGPEGNTISDEIFQSPAESNGINLLYNWRYTDDLRGKKHDAMPKLDAMEVRFYLGCTPHLCLLSKFLEEIFE